MRAIILAGSEGNGLEPITAAFPKAMVKIFGRPCIEYIFDMLIQANIFEAHIVAGYRGGMLEDAYGSSYGKLKLTWIYDDSASGGLGAVRNVFCGDESALVIGGSEFYGFDIGSFVESYEKSGADAAALTSLCENTDGKITVVSDESGLISSVGESCLQCAGFSCEICTGIFIFSKRAAEIVMSCESTGSGGQALENCLKGGLRVLASRQDGFFSDISDISEYIRCQTDLLVRHSDFDAVGHKTLSGNYLSGVYDETQIESPSFIGKNVSIGKGAKISGAVICDNVYIGDNAKIAGSIILSGAHVGSRSKCSGAVVCENAVLLDSSNVSDGSVVGFGAKIGRGAVVEENVRIWPNKQLESYRIAAYDIKHGRITQNIDDDSCVCGETGTEITPEIAVKIGQALSGKGVGIAVGSNGTKAAFALESALIGGVLSGGADVWSVGECTEAELEYASKTAECDYSFYIEADSYAKISAFGKKGVALGSDDEQRMKTALRYGNYPKMSAEDFGTKIDFSSSRRLYSDSLRKRKPTICASFNASGRRMKEICRRLGLENGNAKLSFQLSSDGKKAAAFSPETGFVSYEKLALVCCKDMLDNGKLVCVPFDFPHALDSYAENTEGKIIRSSDESCDTVLRDGIELAFYICNYLAENKTTLENALSQLPKFAVARRVVGINVPLSSAQSRLNAFCSAHSDISVKPSKSGKTLLMRAECSEYETASELCDICERLLENESGS